MDSFNWVDEKKAKQNKALDALQGALSIGGFVPVLGAIPDLANAGISAMRGRWADAGISALSALPFAGDAFGTINLASKAGRIAGVGEEVSKAGRLL
jgi:hypothetical protein